MILEGINIITLNVKKKQLVQFYKKVMPRNVLTVVIFAKKTCNKSLYNIEMKPGISWFL